MKKTVLVTVGLVIIGVLSFGVNSYLDTQQASHGDSPAPKADFLLASHGDSPAPKADVTL
ncbi:Phr family secreted Rap phosphatase inhibitor [Bacillus pseudomycoides]|nr:Phr family secreted Rap phosphatase inhibitor [Bacillus pseudomycoides]